MEVHKQTNDARSWCTYEAETMPTFLTNPNARIGPTFADELKVAGLSGLPFAWGDDGTFCYDPQMTPEQIAAVAVVYAAHDSTKPAAKDPVVLSTDEILALLVKKSILTQKDVDDAKAAKGATT